MFGCVHKAVDSLVLEIQPAACYLQVLATYCNSYFARALLKQGIYIYDSGVETMEPPNRQHNAAERKTVANTEKVNT